MTEPIALSTCIALIAGGCCALCTKSPDMLGLHTSVHTRMDVELGVISWSK